MHCHCLRPAYLSPILSRGVSVTSILPLNQWWVRLAPSKVLEFALRASFESYTTALYHQTYFVRILLAIFHRSHLPSPFLLSITFKTSAALLTSPFLFFAPRFLTPFPFPFPSTSSSSPPQTLNFTLSWSSPSS